MNERIQELIRDVGFTNSDLGDGRDQMLIEFAELIIKECARVARTTPAPNFHEHLKQQLGHTWDMAATEAGREIVKHFGVEP
jgi:hypothetical protein